MTCPTQQSSETVRRHACPQREDGRSLIDQSFDHRITRHPYAAQTRAVTRGQDASRTLLLALDAVSFRIVEAACASGAFMQWTPPTVLVSTFPSLTHPAFASLFEPFGVEPSWGYEVRYFDRASNRIVGANPISYREDIPPWAALLATPRRGVIAKGANYVSSPRAAEGELQAIADDVLASGGSTVIEYLGATDGLTHLYDDDALVEFLLHLDARLLRLQEEHVRARGCPLRIVLFSDHGCGRARVRYTGSLKPLLRSAGLRVVDRLERRDDVVAPTFGIVNYGALFMLGNGERQRAAHAVALHPGVEFAAYSSGADQVSVVSAAGHADVLVKGDETGTRFAYRDQGGDVLRLAGPRDRLMYQGILGPDGFGTSEDWLRETAAEYYPDPLHRLTVGLNGDRVRSRASVLLSLGPGWSWGWRSAYAGGLLRGGPLKGTHGGLDRESSRAFLLVSDPSIDPPPVVRAERALAPYAMDVRSARP